MSERDAIVAVTDADREAAERYLEMTNRRAFAQMKIGVTSKASALLIDAFADHRATHADEVERLREALVRAASRFEIAADNAKDRAPVFRKWAQEARQALEASR